MDDRFLSFVLTPAGFMTIGLTITFTLLVIVLAVAQKRGKLDWRDLITRSNSNKVSLSKLLQLVGGITATWVIVKTTVSSAGISWELFTAYLAYVGSVEAYSKFVAARYNLPTGSTPRTAYQQPYQQPDQFEEEIEDVELPTKPTKRESRAGGAKAM